MTDLTPVGQQHRSILLPLSSERARRPFRSPFRSPDVGSDSLQSSSSASPLLRQKRARLTPASHTSPSLSGCIRSDGCSQLSAVNGVRHESDSSASVCGEDGALADNGGRSSPVIADAACTGRSTPVRQIRRQSSHRTPFAAPADCHRQEQPVTSAHATSTRVSCHDDGASGDASVAMASMDAEIARLRAEGCSVDQLSLYTDALHRYNKVKDAAQVVMGRLAELDGVTVRSVHERFDSLPSSELA